MLSKTPPMGFNTWNTFGENINEQLIKETADKMVELGLRDCGYEYLVIDDCWSKRERDPQTGKIVPDEEKFPNGMKAVSDYVHSKGLKFGMYSCAGTRTCADYPGSFDHEYLDAETFAEYGVDFLKYDFCYKPDSANGPLLYRKMGHGSQSLRTRDSLLRLQLGQRRSQPLDSLGGRAYVSLDRRYKRQLPFVCRYRAKPNRQPRLFRARLFQRH